MAYVAHETLLEAGSTGQRQWTNLQNTLSTKSEAQIFLFDEASNALEQKKAKSILSKVSIHFFDEFNKDLEIIEV
ncbi:hypothetical protein [endosymbiont GvMRE of Glomus versiforme]|uniref:hypothetical protein n=1 Tax=endosymbiont GvMRE of Glomus versiforme TaxID=2039283 RepID=UPI0011C3AA37|nr:hypothetical protein [endosymbiont GvMRE of Glomus versiforme]